MAGIPSSSDSIGGPQSTRAPRITGKLTTPCSTEEEQAARERRIENTIDMAIAHYEEFGIIGAEYSPV